MGNDEITIQNNTTQQVESFMAKDKSIQGKKEQQVGSHKNKRGRKRRDNCSGTEPWNKPAK